MIRLEDQDEEVYVQLIDFGRNATAREVVTANEDGSFTIFVNARISSVRQAEAIQHALRHISSGDFWKDDVQQIEAVAHGLTPAPPPEETYEEKRRKRFEEMRKKNARARKRIQKQLAKKQKQVEFLLETDAEYRREHKLFDI